MITAITHQVHLIGGDHATRLQAYLASPPEWFVKQAKKGTSEGVPERLVKPLASSIAAACLSDPFSWRGVLPTVKDKLKEMA